MNTVAAAFLISLLAGAATAIGGAFAILLRHRIKPVPFAGSLGFAGGVMLFVSFVDIYPEGVARLTEGLTAASPDKSPSDVSKIANSAGMALLFAGWFFASLVDGALHLAMDSRPPKNVHISKSESTLSVSESESELPSDGHKKRQKVPVWWRRLINSKVFKAFVGTEDVSEETKALMEKNFREDCTKITRLGYFTAAVLALHNVPEGVATFTGSAYDLRFGIGLAIAIAIHNIPEGLAVAVPILFGTGSKFKAMLYTIISGMAEPVGGLIAWWILGSDPHNTMFGILFFITAGIMINVAVKELLFTAIKYDPGNRITSVSFTCGMMVMAISLIALEFTSK